MSKISKPICVLVLILTDIAALLTSFLLAFFMRSSVLLSIIPRFERQEPLPLMIHLKLGFLYGALVVIFVLAYEKLYTSRLSFWEETKHLLKGVTISFVFIMVLVFVSRRYIFFSRAVIVFSWLISLVIFPFFRLAVKKVLAKTRLWRRKVLVLGTGEAARQVAKGIKRNVILGYEAVGFLTSRKEEKGKTLEGVKILGDLSVLEKISREMEVKDFIVALPDFSQSELVKVIEDCDTFAETIRVVPNIGSLFNLGVTVENLGDVLSLSVARNLVKPFNIFIKNVFEYLIVVILSLLLLPVFLIIALAIKLDSRGSVLFIQERLGKNGKVFNIFKFRSMCADGDLKLEKYLKENVEARKEWEKFQKIKKNDPRVTGIGKIIRKLSMDELPQLINILKGNMSLVGPRPYLPREIKEIGKSYNLISKVKPGMTGFWQVRGRNLLPFKERLLLDEYYIRNWSLWLDIVILFKTAKSLVKGEGAF